MFIKAIITAAGHGKRMGLTVPKAFTILNGKTLLEYNIDIFLHHTLIMELYITYPVNFYEKTKEICNNRIGNKCKWHLVEGGTSRQKSIYRALNLIDNATHVLIHDVARPYVSNGLINNIIEAARVHNACIPVIPVVDTLKQLDEKKKIIKDISRKNIYKSQTPQCYEIELLKKAYNKAEKEGFEGTDDAALVQRLSYPVHTVKGDSKNYKITYREDLSIFGSVITN